MKVKVYVIDLEIPPRVKRWGLRIGIPLAVLVGGGAIAWAAGLHTWANGDTLNATDLNGNFSNLQAQITALQTAPAPVVAINTTVSGGAGGVQTVSCPSGYNLVAAALAQDDRTQAGIAGWDLGGTIACGIGGNTLTATLGNYSNGAPQTLIQCFGICVHQ